MFYNRVLREHIDVQAKLMCGQKKLHNEFQNLYSSPNI